MTEENQRLRDKLQSIERIVTTALASQPHGDEECGEHLRKSLSDISNAIGEESGGNSAVLRDAMVQLFGELAFCEKNVERECGLSAFGLGQHCKIVRGIIDSALSAPNEHRGNAAAMRDALKYIVSLLRSDTFVVLNQPAVEIIAKILLASEAALTAPPRQCDVGTAEEQKERFDAFCNAQPRKRYGCDCIFQKNRQGLCEGLCEFAWSQTPYAEEEGGAE